MDGGKEPKITIQACTLKEPVVIYGNEIYVVDSLCIYMAKACNIGLIARHIFALWCPDLKIWLNPSSQIDTSESKKWVLQFKVRYRIPCISRLKEIKDLEAFEFCFHQTREDFMVGNIPEISHHKDRNKALGLSATDMIRVMIDENLSIDVMENRYREFLPQGFWKKHKSYLKKPLLDAVDKGLIYSQKNSGYVKEQFLNQVWEIAPDYGCEDYVAQIDDEGKIWEILLQINPYHKNQPGLRIQKPRSKNGQWIHICSIEDLYFISMRKDNSVELSRRNGIPQYFKFPSVDQMQSFISCLDGYYRLTEKWTFNLCKELPTPSLLKLKSMKCHGPVGYQLSCQKLKEKCQLKPGSFLLRESSSDYDQFRVDICCNNEDKPITMHIDVTANETFTLHGNDGEFETIPQLVDHVLNQFNVQNPRFCVTPSEYDKNHLTLCRPSISNQVNEILQSQREYSYASQCIPSSSVVFNRSKELRGHFISVCPAFLRQSSGDMKPIFVKSLNKEAMGMYIQEFLHECGRVLLWKSEAIVLTIGVILCNPLALVLENLPLGPLDQYLHSHISDLEQVDLIEGASYLARALWYLKEQDYPHGSIRCCNIYVEKHIDNCFKVKLGDPGLPIYSSRDLPWIPPEFHNDPIRCRQSSAADAWAFGTTLWEIFSFGEIPVIRNYQNLELLEGHPLLTIPKDCHDDIYKLMIECWVSDPDSRKQPQAILRDINQILYEVYNSRRSNSYASVNPISCPSPEHSPISLSPPPFSPRSFENRPTTPSHKSSFIKGFIQSVRNSTQSYDQLSTYSGSSARSTFTMISSAESLSDLPHTPVESLITLDARRRDSQLDNNAGLMDTSSPWVIDITHLTMGKTLGQGFYGEVCKATLSLFEGLNEETVAVKRIKKSVLSEDGMRDLLREINIMKSLRHNNIVEIKGLVEDPQTMLVMEYLEMGSLLAHLQMYKKTLTISSLLKFASDIAQGMHYLEEKHIVHRDLASRNILVASPSHVKISDFGLAQFTENHYYCVRTERNLPIRWYSPESIKYGKFSHKSDVWSYGVTLWEMFSYGENPIIPNVTDTNLLEALEQGKRLCCPFTCPLEVYRLMCDCWQVDTHVRPCFLRIYEQTEELRERF